MFHRFFWAYLSSSFHLIFRITYTLILNISSITLFAFAYYQNNIWKENSKKNAIIVFEIGSIEWNMQYKSFSRSMNTRLLVVKVLLLLLCLAFRFFFTTHFFLFHFWNIRSNFSKINQFKAIKLMINWLETMFGEQFTLKLWQKKHARICVSREQKWPQFRIKISKINFWRRKSDLTQMFYLVRLHFVVCCILLVDFNTFKVFTK